MKKYTYIDPVTRDLEESEEHLVALTFDGKLPALSAANLTDFPDQAKGIDGKPADYISDVYKSDEIILPGEYPTGGTYDGISEVLPGPNNTWYDDPMSPVAGEYVWRSSKRYYTVFESDKYVWKSDGSWTVPLRYLYIPILGRDYKTSNTFVSYVFRKENIGITPAKPTNGSYDGTTEYQPTIPEEWKDNPEPPEYNEVAWISTRTYSNLDNAGWNVSIDWSVPVKFTATNSLNGYLTNDNISVATDSSGNNPILTEAVGLFKVHFGDVEVTNNCTFAVLGDSIKNSLSIYIDSSGSYIVTDLGWSSVSETFDLVATHNDNNKTLIKAFTINKSKDGEKGDSGESVVTSLSSDNGTSFRNNTGVNKKITANVYLDGVISNSNDYIYKWFSDITPVYINISSEFVGYSPGAGKFLADGETGMNSPFVIVDPTDVADGNNINLICEISNI